MNLPLPDKDFDIKDPKTWPVVMNVHHILAIYGGTDSSLKKACQEHRFLPAPYRKRPYLWRRSAVIRDAAPEQTTGLRRVG